MTNNIVYSDAPTDISQALVGAAPVEDFLPSPEQLVLKTEKERITIALDKHSLELFRRYAKAHDAKYQSMINSVLSSYADTFLAQK